MEKRSLISKACLHLCFFITSMMIRITQGSSIYLEVVTNPIVFGKDVEIKCRFGSNNNCKFSRTWTCGPRYEPVVMNGVSADYLKYEESRHEYCKYSILKIKDFSESDVDIVYKCTHGFDSYERVLNLNQHKFEYHPKERITTTDIIVSENKVYAHLRFQNIFPPPICQGNINNEDITSSLHINTRRKGIFFETNVTLDHQEKKPRCDKSFYISCKVGHTTIPVADLSYPCAQKGVPTGKRGVSSNAEAFSTKYCNYNTLLTFLVTLFMFQERNVYKGTLP